MFPEIKNVVFDLGGVLADLDIDRCRGAFRALGMPQIAELIHPYYPAEVFEQLESGDITAHEACEQMRSIANRPDINDEQIAHAYQQFIVGIPTYKLRMLRSLREAGIKVYMLSNNNPMVMPHIISECFTADGLTVNDYFDKLYISCEMHDLKPRSSIFEKMIADSGLIPEQTLFIDDGQRNVEAAQKLRFNVYMPAPREDFSHLFVEILKK